MPGFPIIALLLPAALIGLIAAIRRQVETSEVAPQDGAEKIKAVEQVKEAVESGDPLQMREAAEVVRPHYPDTAKALDEQAKVVEQRPETVVPAGPTPPPPADAPKVPPPQRAGKPKPSPPVTPDPKAAEDLKSPALKSREDLVLEANQTIDPYKQLDVAAELDRRGDSETAAKVRQRATAPVKPEERDEYVARTRAQLQLDPKHAGESREELTARANAMATIAENAHSSPDVARRAIEQEQKPPVSPPIEIDAGVARQAGIPVPSGAATVKVTPAEVKKLPEPAKAAVATSAAAVAQRVDDPVKLAAAANVLDAAGKPAAAKAAREKSKAALKAKASGAPAKTPPVKKPSEKKPVEKIVIEYGSRGALVGTLQAKLNKLGFLKYGPKGVPDEVFGSVTREAVKAFEKSAGLTVDGTVDAVMWAELEKRAPGVAAPKKEFGKKDKKPASKAGEPEVAAIVKGARKTNDPAQLEKLSAALKSRGAFDEAKKLDERIVKIKATQAKAGEKKAADRAAAEKKAKIKALAAEALKSKDPFRLTEIAKELDSLGEKKGAEAALKKAAQSSPSAKKSEAKKPEAKKPEAKKPEAKKPDGKDSPDAKKAIGELVTAAMKETDPGKLHSLAARIEKIDHESAKKAAKAVRDKAEKILEKAATASQDQDRARKAAGDAKKDDAAAAKAQAVNQSAIKKLVERASKENDPAKLEQIAQALEGLKASNVASTVRGRKRKIEETLARAKKEKEAKEKEAKAPKALPAPRSDKDKELDRLMDEATAKGKDKKPKGKVGDSSPVPNPFAGAGIPDDRWQQFVDRSRVGKMDSVTPNFQLGAFQMGMRRLADLGLVKDVKRGQFRGRTVWMGDWHAPNTLGTFLNDPDLQLQAFIGDVRGRMNFVGRNREWIGAVIDGVPATLSGLVAVARQTGDQGLAKWMAPDAQRFPETLATFKLMNGIF